MNITTVQYQELLTRTARNPHRDPPADAMTDEGDLHDQICRYCDGQWPRWKYRHARMDKKTTEAKGVEDFTIFAPDNKTYHFECKASGKKQTTEQLGWECEMKLLGHTVHIIYTFEQFKNIVSPLPCSDTAAERVKKVKI